MWANKRVRTFSLIIAIVILSFIVTLAFAIGDHNCSGEHCAICLSVSKLSFCLVAASVFIISTPFSINILRFKATETCRDTLITLKRKITS